MFDERDPSQKGTVGISIDGFTTVRQATVDPATRRIYGLDTFDRNILVFDEDRLTKIGQYRYDFSAVGSLVTGLLLAQDGLIIESTDTLTRIALADLAPNLPEQACQPVDLSDTLTDGLYQRLGCDIIEAVYDETRDVIYGSVAAASGPSGNSIAVIDAGSFEIIQYIPLAGTARGLSISPDDAILHAVLSGSTLAVQIELADRTLSRTTNLGYSLNVVNELDQPNQGVATAASPTGVDDFIVSTSQREVMLFSSGQLQGEVADNVEAYQELFIGETDSSQLIGREFDDLGILSVTSAGVIEQQELRNFLNGSELTQDGDTLYSNLGERFDILTLTGSTACTLPIGVAPWVVASAGGNATLYFAATGFGRISVDRCDLQNDTITSTVIVPVFGEVSAGPGRELTSRNNDLLLLRGSKLVKFAAP